jgi:hypothetical protein
MNRKLRKASQISELKKAINALKNESSNQSTEFAAEISAEETLSTSLLANLETFQNKFNQSPDLSVR